MSSSLVARHARQARGDVRRRRRRRRCSAGAAVVDLAIPQRVVAAATEQPVEPGTAVEIIVAAAAAQHVGAVTALEMVLATAPVQYVVAAERAQHVITRTANEAVRPGGADHHLRPGATHIGCLDQLVAAEGALARAGLGGRLIARARLLSRATERHRHTRDSRQRCDRDQESDSELHPSIPLPSMVASARLRRNARL